MQGMDVGKGAEEEMNAAMGKRPLRLWIVGETGGQGPRGNRWRFHDCSDIDVCGLAVASPGGRDFVSCRWCVFPPAHGLLPLRLWGGRRAGRPRSE